MSHDAHLADAVGTLRPDICSDCRALVAADTFPGVGLAQAKLNRAVSRWAIRRSPTAGSQLDVDLLEAHRQFQEVCEAAFMDAAQNNPQVIGIVNPKPPHIPWRARDYETYDVATEARIANLLAVSEQSRSMSLAGADTIRQDALIQALRMLGLRP